MERGTLRGKSTTNCSSPPLQDLDSYFKDWEIVSFRDYSDPFTISASVHHWKDFELVGVDVIWLLDSLDHKTIVYPMSGYSCETSFLYTLSVESKKVCIPISDWFIDL